MKRKQGLGKALTKLYKSYLFTVVAKDLKKLAEINYGREFAKASRRVTRNINLDKRYWLHRVGLTPYTPVKSSLATGLMFLVGAGVGALAGLAMAPMRGEEFRREMKSRASEMMAKQQLGQTQAPAEA